MPFVSITRLKVRSIFKLPGFLRANGAATRQLVKITGFISGKELADKNLTFWTLTIWENEESMRQFRNSPAHKKAMQKLPSLCSEASYFHFLQDESVLPDWEIASGKLLQEGKLTKVRKPSSRQLENRFPAIKWTKFEKVFRPKG